MSKFVCVHCDPTGKYQPGLLVPDCGFCCDQVDLPCPGCECDACWANSERLALGLSITDPSHVHRRDVIYTGLRLPHGCEVYRRTPGWPADRLDPRHDLRNHSPCGFEWGYGGSGPAQLALALLADAADDQTALNHYQRFKFKHIAGLTEGEWFMSSGEILDFVEREKRSGIR